MADTESELLHYAHHHRHWYYLHRHRSHKKDRTAHEILLGQLISVTGSIIAGYVLDLTKTELITVTGTFLLLPGVFDLGGSVAGAMGARINHRLSEGNPQWRVVRDSLLHAFSLVATAAVFLALMASLPAVVFFHASFWAVFIIVIGSAAIASTVGLPIIALATLWSYRLGKDPDNFIGPIETSVFDTVTVLAVVLMVLVVR